MKKYIKIRKILFKTKNYYLKTQTRPSRSSKNEDDTSNKWYSMHDWLVCSPLNVANLSFYSSSLVS